jgi:hypothetical protein
MSTASILLDSGLENISTILGTRLHFSSALCSELLSANSYTPSLSKILNNQTCITELRSLSSEKKDTISKIVDDIVAYEREAQFFFEEKKSLDSLEKVGNSWLAECKMLQTIDFTGLESLEKVDNRWLSECKILQTVDFNGLEALEEVGKLVIVGAWTKGWKDMVVQMPGGSAVINENEA